MSNTHQFSQDKAFTASRQEQLVPMTWDEQEDREGYEQLTFIQQKKRELYAYFALPSLQVTLVGKQERSVLFFAEGGDIAVSLSPDTIGIIVQTQEQPYIELDYFLRDPNSGDFFSLFSQGPFQAEFFEPNEQGECTLKLHWKQSGKVPFPIPTVFEQMSFAQADEPEFLEDLQANLSTYDNLLSAPCQMLHELRNFLCDQSSAQFQQENKIQLRKKGLMSMYQPSTQFQQENKIPLFEGKEPEDNLEEYQSILRGAQLVTLDLGNKVERVKLACLPRDEDNHQIFELDIAGDQVFVELETPEQGFGAEQWFFLLGPEAKEKVPTLTPSNNTNSADWLRDLVSFLNNNPEQFLDVVWGIYLPSNYS